eukprot:11208387-Lingulodinium_polyedra.AAC.1
MSRNLLRWANLGSPGPPRLLENTPRSARGTAASTVAQAAFHRPVSNQLERATTRDLRAPSSELL